MSESSHRSGPIRVMSGDLPAIPRDFPTPHFRVLSPDQRHNLIQRPSPLRVFRVMYNGIGLTTPRGRYVSHFYPPVVLT